MISTKTGFGLETDIIFQKHVRIVDFHYPIISGSGC